MIFMTVDIGTLFNLDIRPMKDILNSIMVDLCNPGLVRVDVICSEVKFIS